MVSAALLTRQRERLKTVAQLGGGSEPSFAPSPSVPSLDLSMIMIVDHLSSNFAN